MNDQNKFGSQVVAEVILTDFSGLLVALDFPFDE